jgi:hypothetical protein
MSMVYLSETPARFQGRGSRGRALSSVRLWNVASLKRISTKIEFLPVISIYKLKIS